MPRSKPQHMSLKDREVLLGEFWVTIALFDDVQQIRSFFKDLLSETEALMLARRLKIATLLYKGKSYEDIEKLLRTGSATIASVHAWLDGGFGGYIQGIVKLEQMNRKKTFPKP